MKFPFLHSRFHRCIPASLLAIALGASVAGSGWAAEGRGGRMRAQVARQAPFAARTMRPERPAVARAQQAREQAAQLHAAPPAAPVESPVEAPPVDRGGRPGRLTPQERRALRQQINDAGRDIYRAPRP